jgi:amino acid transporter/mannitol/fructose-specific phosphotransferase system IIA component (Ntr-type)
MAILSKSKQLKKELTLLNVYAIATGATIASGFFLLPGIAAAQAGPAVILSYLIAALPVLPAVLSKAELATAMPRAGGVYYFLDRSMGPLFGTIGGLGTWLALILKTTFALIGMGAYLNLIFPNIPMIPFAILLAVAFGYLNLFGAKKTGGFQIVLVITLLIILAGFSGHGVAYIRPQHFHGFFDKGFDAILGTAGLVYVSYVGISKVASVSEEVKNPDRNLPLGMFLALITAVVIYALGTTVMVGVLPPEQLHNDLTPVASTAHAIAGSWGRGIVIVAALLAFSSVANTGILSASRYPLAMSRDHLLPRFFRFLNKHRTPKISIYITVGVIILCLTSFDPTKIAKLASAFQLLLFALNCLAVIIMRESRIQSYDPGFRSPLYPWVQIIGIIIPFALIGEMGWYPTVFTIGLIILGTSWYFFYGRNRVVRDGAIYHIFARLGERRFEGLDRELRGILKEKGARAEDPFDVVIARAGLIDLSHSVSFEDVVAEASESLSQKLNLRADLMKDGFLQGTRVGATPVSHGVALPHMRSREITQPEIIIVRVQEGVKIDFDDGLLDNKPEHDLVYAFFFLVSPESNPGQHLRILAQIAGQVDDERFIRHWLLATNEQEMKELLLRDERFFALQLRANSKSATLINLTVRDLNMPLGSLVALIHRGGEIIFPRGSTRLEAGDRLTIIGEPLGVQKLREKYSDDN